MVVQRISDRAKKHTGPQRRCASGAAPLKAHCGFFHHHILTVSHQVTNIVSNPQST